MLSVAEPLATFTVLADRLGIGPRCEGHRLRDGLARKIQLRFVRRAVGKAHQRAAAFAVARVEPHRKALRPVRIALLAKLHLAAGLRIGPALDQ
jgi:hypothetical protein